MRPPPPPHCNPPRAHPQSEQRGYDDIHLRERKCMLTFRCHRRRRRWRVVARWWVGERPRAALPPRARSPRVAQPPSACSASWCTPPAPALSVAKLRPRRDVQRVDGVRTAQAGLFSTGVAPPGPHRRWFEGRGLSTSLSSLNVRGREYAQGRDMQHAVRTLSFASVDAPDATSTRTAQRDCGAGGVVVRKPNCTMACRAIWHLNSPMFHRAMSQLKREVSRWRGEGEETVVARTCVRATSAHRLVQRRGRELRSPAKATHQRWGNLKPMWTRDLFDSNRTARDFGGR